jgi:hypothetical protein
MHHQRSVFLKEVGSEHADIKRNLRQESATIITIFKA